MKRNSQIIAEGLFPLLGFYFWDWSWYFILLFYILDVFAKEVILHLQSRKIYQTQGGEITVKTWKNLGFKSLIANTLTLALLHIMQFMKQSDFSLFQEFSAFMNHEEWGVKQGLILVPLVFLNVWMQYKLGFLKPKQHLTTKMSQMWQTHVQYRFFIMSLAAIALGISALFVMGDQILLWGAVLAPVVYLKLIKKSV